MMFLFLLVFMQDIFVYNLLSTFGYHYISVTFDLHIFSHHTNQFRPKCQQQLQYGATYSTIAWFGR